MYYPFEEGNDGACVRKKAMVRVKFTTSITAMASKTIIFYARFSIFHLDSLRVVQNVDFQFKIL